MFIHRDLLKNDAVFYVPEVIKDLSSKEVLTTELVSGVTLDKLESFDQETRNVVSNLPKPTFNDQSGPFF